MQVQNIHASNSTVSESVRVRNRTVLLEFYKVSATGQRAHDAESLYTRRFVNTCARAPIRGFDVRFDHEAHKAALRRGASIDVPARGTDVPLRVLLCAQPGPCRPVRPQLPTHDTRRATTWSQCTSGSGAGAGGNIRLRVVDRSQIGGVFKSRAASSFGSRTTRRRLLDVKSKVPVGSISISLTDIFLSLAQAGALPGTPPRDDLRGVKQEARSPSETPIKSGLRTIPSSVRSLRSPMSERSHNSAPLLAEVALRELLKPGSCPADDAPRSHSGGPRYNSRRGAIQLPLPSCSTGTAAILSPRRSSRPPRGGIHDFT